jgi:hypothetical protein
MSGFTPNMTGFTPNMTGFTLRFFSDTQRPPPRDLPPKILGIELLILDDLKKVNQEDLKHFQRRLNGPG